MFSSFSKIVPILSLMGVGVGAQEIAAQQSVKQVPAKQSAMPCGIVEGDNCYARSCSCAMGGAAEFDFLYWGAANTGFIYGYEIKDSGATATANNIGSLLRLPMKWDPGFRVGVGLNMDYDRWDLFLDWTWFRAHEDKSKSITGSGTLGFFSVWPNTTLAAFTAFQDIHAGWRMCHNAIDLELGRAYYLTKEITLRMHYGLRGGWINQKFHTNLSNQTVPVSSELDFHGKNNFWGIGPRVGVHSKWYIDHSNWSILGKASGSLLLGKTKTHFLSDSWTVAAVHTAKHHVNDHFTDVVPNVQLFLGLDWGSCLDCNKYYLGVNAGWELNYYWNQFNIAAINEASASMSPSPVFGNHGVMMQGLTVNVHFDF